MPSEAEAAGSPTILVVDDDRNIRELHAGVLNRFGYRVDTAQDGDTAWIALMTNSYDLLITDHRMPRMTGLELIQKLRSREMNLAVILMSGTMPTEEIKRRPDLKIDATLEKPFTVEDLLDTVKKALRVADAPQASQPSKDGDTSGHRPAATEKPAPASVQDQTNQARRILVVDDDNELRKLSADLLTGSGYHVEGVKDGASGWEALRANHYDLVITDNKMPNMTGLELIAKLRSARMAVPVLMATGVLPMNEFAHKPWLKPDAMLQRPFSNENLLQAVQEILGTDDGCDGGAKTLLPEYL